MMQLDFRQGNPKDAAAMLEEGAITWSSPKSSTSSKD